MSEHEQLTVVLVHGAFAESASWAPVIERLWERGLRVVAAPNPLRDLAGDAAAVRDVVAGLATPVVLVGHSYGGMVVTEAAAGNDSVEALVYVGAFLPAHGESASELSTRFPGSSLGEALASHPLSSGGEELVIRPELFHHQFAADVPAHRARLLAATQRPVTAAALSEGLPAEVPGWADRPSFSVFGELDLNIPVELQRFMAERAGAKVTREIAGASHAVALSEPDAVAATILDAVAVW